MTYDDAKGVCKDTFSRAQRRVGPNKEAIALEVALLASCDRNVMEALTIVAKVVEPSAQRKS